MLIRRSFFNALVGTARAVASLDRNKLTTHLWDKHRIIVTPIAHEEFQGIRVTPNVYTTLSEIDAFSVAMEKVIQSGV